MKFDVDQRNNTLSVQVRRGYISRENALKEYSEPPILERDILDYVKKRLEISASEFDRILKSPVRSAQDYPTYKSRFERMGWLFLILLELELVPTSFYLKYCFPMKDEQ